MESVSTEVIPVSGSVVVVVTWGVIKVVSVLGISRWVVVVMAGIMPQTRAMSVTVPIVVRVREVRMAGVATMAVSTAPGKSSSTASVG